MVGRLFVAALGLAVVACLPARRASTAELQARAIFDLGCPAQQMQMFPLGPRIRAVSGCGRRLVYIERCDPELAAEASCAWTLDTPSVQQDQWPQRLEAVARQRALASAGPAAAAAREPQPTAPAKAPSSSAEPASGPISDEQASAIFGF